MDHFQRAIPFTALFSLDGEEALDVMEYAAERLNFGSPLPPLGSIKDEAAWWTSRATEDELRYYLVAMFIALPEQLQIRLSDYARKYCRKRAIA